MLKFLNKKKDNKGFSLVELIIVVAIMAILVGLLAPQYLKYVEKSRKSADASNLNEMVQAVQVYAADADTTLPKGSYTITIGTTSTTLTPDAADTKGEFTKALQQAVPDYASIKLKSNKWDSTGNGGTTSLAATIAVDAEGGTTVTYSSDDFAKFINKK